MSKKQVAETSITPEQVWMQTLLASINRISAGDMVKWCKDTMNNGYVPPKDDKTEVTAAFVIANQAVNEFNSIFGNGHERELIHLQLPPKEQTDNKPKQDVVNLWSNTNQSQQPNNQDE